MPRVLLSMILVALVGCSTPGEKSQPDAQMAAGTCEEIFPSYWQDPNPKFAAMWEGQTTSDAPPKGWDGPVFRLSDAYPTSPVDESGAANTDAASPVNMTVQISSGEVNVLGDEPVYADGRKDWISLDFSLQLSISLTQWGQWQQHVAQASASGDAERVHSAEPPAR